LGCLCGQDKIAGSLVEQENFLQASHFGHFFLRKLSLPLYQRRREEWKAKMAAAAASEVQGRGTGANSVVAAAPKKRKEGDVIDELFSSKKARTLVDSSATAKRIKTTERSEGKGGRAETVDGDLQSVLRAIKASKGA
jgi:nucleolar protein 9